MATDLLVLSVAKIPESVARLNSGFSDGVFNIAGTKRLLNGYAVDDNENRILPETLCHDENYLLYLCRGEVDPQKAVESVLKDSYAIKTSEYFAMKNDVNSEWYQKEALTE